MNSLPVIKPSFILRAVLLASCLIAVACSGAAPTATSTVPPAAPTATPTSKSSLPTATVVPTNTPIPTPTAGVTPKSGGVMTETATGDPNSYNPGDTASGPALPIIAPLFSELVWNPSGQTIETDAAASYLVTSDGLTWTFKLRSNILFSPGTPANPRDGTPMTATDVQYTIQKWMGFQDDMVPSTRCGLLKQFVDTSRPDHGVEVVDPLTVQIHMAHPFGSLLTVLATNHCAIVPAGTTTAMGKVRPYGSGPFVLKSASTGALYVHVRNPNYFKPGLPYLDQVNVEIITNTAALESAFLTGRLDISGGTPSKDNNSAFQDMSNQGKIHLLPYSTQCRVQGIFMNPTIAPFNDPNLRQAVQLVLDRQAWSQIVHNGLDTPTLLLDTFGGQGHTVAEIMQMPGWRQPHDADVAQALSLAKVAIPSGLDVLMNTDNSTAHMQMSQLAVNDLSKIGIRAKLDIFDPAGNDNADASMKYAIRADQYCQTTATPEELFGSYFVTGGARNQFPYSNPKIDAAFQDMAATNDPVARKAKAIAMEDIIMKDNVVAPGPVQESFRWEWSYIHDLPIGITFYMTYKNELVWRNPAS